MQFPSDSNKDFFSYKTLFHIDEACIIIFLFEIQTLTKS